MRRLLAHYAVASVLGVVLAPVGHAQSGLANGATSDPFTLAPGETRAFYIDVPDDATHLQLLLESERAETVEDVDLFLRFDEPFDPQRNPFAQALYYAVGETGLEHLEITFAHSPPLSPGRWHVLVANPLQDVTARNAELTAVIRREPQPTLAPLELEIAYTDAPGTGFDDPTPFQPQGGNNAATLGEARRIVFNKAVELLQESFTSPVVPLVEARFEAMEDGDDDDGTTLASAETSALADFPGARATDTWYATSIVPRLAGTDTCRVASLDCREDPEADVVIRFNPDPPSPGWWYGLERSPNGLQDGFDFIAVAMHEMLHGLGFVSFANVETGALALGNDDVERTDAYTRRLVHQKDGEFRQVDALTDAERRQAFTSRGRLLWDGEYGEEFWDFVSPPKPNLYAPEEPRPGSSVSHVDFSDIMFHQGNASTADRDIETRKGGPELGAAWYFLRDAGWDENPKPKLGDAVAPRPGMWFDVTRDGHGFDLQRQSGPDGGEIWFLTFFSYGDEGDAEWLLGIGEVENGVFTGDLERFTFDFDAAEGAVPQTGEKAGDASIDFTASAQSEACDDGADRSGAERLAVFAWTIDGESGEWCVQPLIASDDPTPSPDHSGHWWAGESDQGWGLTVYQQGSILFAVLYYYDSEGEPRWALGSTDDWSNGDEIVMQQIAGYCRACEPTELGEQQAGTLVLDLDAPTQAENDDNRATVDVTWQEAPGGRWHKDNVRIRLLSDPAD